VLHLQHIAILGYRYIEDRRQSMNAEQNKKEKDGGVQPSSNDTEYDNEGDDDDLSLSKLFNNEDIQQQQQQSKSDDKEDSSKKDHATTSKSTTKISKKRPADKVSNSSSSTTKKPSTKKRKRSPSTKQSPTTTSQLTPSRQRMNEAINKCTQTQKELRRALAALEKAKATVSTCRLNFINTKKLVESVAKDECEELLKESSQWNDMYHKLSKYKSINGHCNVKQNVSRNFDGEVKEDLSQELVKQLSSWVGKIRKEYKQQQKRSEESTTTDNEEIADTEPYKSIALDNIGFQYDPRNNKWLSQYEELKRYKAQHGNTLVKHSNSGLGAWVKRQQVQYTLYCKRDGTKSDLTVERVQLLNDLGFVWSRRTNTWNENFDRLVKWKETHGNCHMIPDKSTDPEVAQLHKWVSDQRMHYKQQDKNTATDKQDCVAADSSSTTKNSKKKKALPKLSQDKIDKLKGIGFEFDARDVKWLQKFDVLLKYKQRHGDFLVPSNYQEDLSLSNWVANQRAQYNLYMKGSKSHMTERRLKILTDAGFPFSATEDNQQQQEKNENEKIQQEEDKVKFDAKPWMEKYKELLLHIATHGSLDSLQASNPLLAEWEANQTAPTASTTASFKQKDDENMMNKEKELMSTARLFLSLQGSSSSSSSSSKK